MTLTVIGSQGAYPAADNPSSGYLLQHEGFSLMLEFGSGVLFKLHEVLDINSLDAVYLSHFHADHIADIGCLQYAVKVQTDIGNTSGVLPIYAPDGTDEFEKLTYHEYTKGVPVSPDESLTIGPFECRFLENPHPTRCLAIRLSCGGKSLVYTSDTGWNDELVSFAEGCDLLLCESSLFNRFYGMVSGHLTSGEAGRLAKGCGTGMLLLCHFPHYGIREELILEAEETFSGEIALALPASVFNLTDIESWTNER
ncbi:MAG: MBL fold metallo-hydrolase [Spirochaetales bacterium]|nr:MBL fold metallo-hydrolase [Spirochaetales bacterium]